MRSAPPARASLLLSLVALTAAACGGGDGSSPAQAAAQGGRAGRGGAGGPIPVESIHVQSGSIARNVTVAGIVEPIRVVGVNSQLAGAVLAIQVEEGSAVRQGAVLARLDDREIAAQLAAAEAAYQVTEAAYARAEQLRDRRVITLPEYERERTAFAAAKAQYDQLRTRAGYAIVRAPITGVITEKNVEAGDVVSGQTRLFTIADVSSMVVRVGVSELDVVELAPGDDVRVTLDAIPDRPLAGQIRRVFPGGDPTTRLVPVEVVLDATSASFARPGFLARATFALSERENVLLVPQNALVVAQGSQAVFVIQNGTAVRRTVETGVISIGRVEILAGLQEGDEVVTVGSHNLRDGMSVRSVSAAPVPPASAADSPGALPADVATPALTPHVDGASHE